MVKEKVRAHIGYGGKGNSYHTYILLSPSKLGMTKFQNLFYQQNLSLKRISQEKHQEIMEVSK